MSDSRDADAPSPWRSDRRRRRVARRPSPRQAGTVVDGAPPAESLLSLFIVVVVGAVFVGSKMWHTCSVRRTTSPVTANRTW